MALFQPHDCQGCELKSCDFHPSSRRVYQRKVSSKLQKSGNRVSLLWLMPMMKNWFIQLLRMFMMEWCHIQAAVNACSEILKGPHQLQNDPREVDTNSEDSGVHWPSNEDAGCLLEFVAQFVASTDAVVSSSTFMKILEYVASPTAGSEVARDKEDLMARLLSAVPDSNLDASRTPLLAERSNFC